MNVICYNRNNFGHMAKNCRTNFVRQKMQSKKKNIPPSVNKCSQNFEKKEGKEKKKPKKVWKEEEKKPTQLMIAQTTLHVINKKLWVIDSG